MSLFFPVFLQTFLCNIHKMSTDFQDYAFQNSVITLQISLTYSPLIYLPRVTYVYSSLHRANDKELPFHHYNLSAKVWSCLASYSQSENYRLFISTGNAKLHKLSQTSVKLLTVHRLSRPWKWQIILFPNCQRTSKTTRTLGIVSGWNLHTTVSDRLPVA